MDGQRNRRTGIDLGPYSTAGYFELLGVAGIATPVNPAKKKQHLT
jgi:hypothetical protein